MHTLEIPDKSIITEFPSEIDEMSNEQFLCYVDLVLQYNSGQIGEHEFKAKLVQKLLDIRTSIKYGVMNADDKEVCDTNLARISELMDCFIEEFEKNGQMTKAFKLISTRNFVPRILSYHGPKDGFENLTFCEYRIARNFFRKFAETSEESHLNLLIAVLYRPAKRFTWLLRWFRSWDGEIRSDFNSKSNPDLIEKRAKKIARTSFAIRYCVFLYFAGCEEFLKTVCPVIDGVELDFSQLYKESSDDDKGNVGMVGLLYSMAESGVFGNIEQTDKQNLWDIMVRVYQVVMQARQFEQKTKEHGTGT